MSECTGSTAGDIPLPSSGTDSNGSTTVTTFLPSYGNLSSAGMANHVIPDATGSTVPSATQTCDPVTLAYYQAYYAQCGYPGYPATGTNMMVPTGTNMMVPTGTNMMVPTGTNAMISTVPSASVTSYPIPVTNANSASSGYDFRTQVPVAVPSLQTTSVPLLQTNPVPPLASNLVPQVPILAPHLQPVPTTVPGTCTSVPAIPGTCTSVSVEAIPGSSLPPGVEAPVVPGVSVYPIVPMPPIPDSVPDTSYDTNDGLQEEEEEDPTVDRNYGKAGGGANDPLPIHGNQKTMNLNPLLLTNIQQSTYFKVTLYKLKTINELIDEIWYNVKHMEPWERGSRKVSDQ